MNDLEKFFEANTGHLIHKWMHYFEIYDRHFASFRGTDVHILEFGVSQGGSLDMWKHYFGPRCRIYGVDINPHCKALEDEDVTIFIGDQEDRDFLRSLTAKIPRIDILIDDVCTPRTGGNGAAATGVAEPSSSTPSVSSIGSTPGIRIRPRSRWTSSRARRIRCTGTTACW